MTIMKISPTIASLFFLSFLHESFQYDTLGLFIVSICFLASSTNTNSFSKFTFISRLTRSKLLDVLKSDYIRTAKSKGVNGRSIMFKHALRNTLIPIVTYVGPLIAGILTGSFVVEKIFAYPGMGYLLNQAYSFKDRAILQTALLFFGMLTLLGNIFIDVGYMIVDPRIREGKVK